MYEPSASHNYNSAEAAHDLATTSNLLRQDIATLEQEQLKDRLPLSSTTVISRKPQSDFQDTAEEGSTAPTFRAQAEETTIRQFENAAQLLRDDHSLQETTSTTGGELSDRHLPNGQPTGYRKRGQSVNIVQSDTSGIETSPAQKNDMPPTPSFTGLDTDIPRGSFDVPFSSAAHGGTASVARVASVSSPGGWPNGAGIQYFPAGSVKEVDHKIRGSIGGVSVRNKTIRVVPPSDVESAAEDDETVHKHAFNTHALNEGLSDIRIDSGTGDEAPPFTSQRGKWPLSRPLDAEQSSRENSSPAKEPNSGTPASEDKRSSRFIRSIYEAGGEYNIGEASSNYSSPSKDSDVQVPDPTSHNAGLATLRAAPSSRRVPHRSTSAYSSLLADHERAGGVEDWDGVTGDDVDRFGFVRVNPKRASAPLPATFNLPSSPSHSLAPSARSNDSVDPRGNRLQVPRSQRSQMGDSRSGNSPSSMRGLRSTSGSIRFLQSPRRAAMMEAQSMMAADIPTQDNDDPPDDADNLLVVRNRGKLQVKREQKWRKMGKMSGRVVSGYSDALKVNPVHFLFDIYDPKVISRTWKGVPDSMRAEAWWSFLDSASRTARPTSATPRASEEELIARYNELQEIDFEDDTQIDMDVPRTIGAHICFRRRYRGGQRLLFRLLHALALYFPEVGYAQGMAPIAATLLVYFVEERAFVAAVRLWTYKGIAWLYGHGFDQLMEVLSDFKVNWLQKPGTPLYDIDKKLEAIGVVDTIWATKWYLTLFQYVLPYEAHLRILDVFILLGSSDDPKKKPDVEVLHSITAALLLGMREKILAPTAQFEDVMGLLTNKIVLAGSDEGEGGRGMDALMNVAKMEFKSRSRY